MNKLLTLAAILLSSSAFATNITINDGRGKGDSWYSIHKENQEVEPGNLIGQMWDMESFELNGSNLRMTGGFNFTQPQGYKNFRPGDIFFDINGGGYDLVATVGQAENTYDVYTLGSTYSVYHTENSSSNPWRYEDGGTLVRSDLAVSYGSFASSEGWHYTLDMNINWLSSFVKSGDTITIHNTMECGNDNLMGQFKQVPDPSSSGLLFGLSFLGLWGLTTRKN